MRADRLIAEILLLQAHGQLSGRELAERLEVSERTVHRDMEALSAAGVPVFALRGAQGGWQLDENWRTKVPGLDEAELRALLMVRPHVVGDPRLAAAAERAFSKLMAALPSGLREKAASIRQRLHVDTTAWRGSGENLAMLPIVQDAVSHDRKLLIRYRLPDGESGERTIDPLGLVAKGSSWYLAAHTPRGLRTYRVSRIEEARLLGQKCQRPENFDLADYWKSSTDRFKERWKRFEVKLRMEPRAAEEFKMWHIANEVEHPEKPDPKGWITLRAHFDSEAEARFLALGFGSRLEVLEPENLRDRILSEAKTIVERALS